jgi:hypothetical protein
VIFLLITDATGPLYGNGQYIFSSGEFQWAVSLPIHCGCETLSSNAHPLSGSTIKYWQTHAVLKDVAGKCKILHGDQYFFTFCMALLWQFNYGDYYGTYPQKLALTSPSSGGRSVGIVRLRTKGHGV